MFYDKAFNVPPITVLACYTVSVCLSEHECRDSGCDGRSFYLFVSLYLDLAALRARVL